MTIKLPLWLYFLLGLALGLSAASAYAETIPATYVTAPTKWYAALFPSRGLFNTPQAACDAVRAYMRGADYSLNGPYNGQYSCYTDGGQYNRGAIISTPTCNDGSSPVNGQCLGCPDSSWTFENGQCTRPDQSKCVAKKDTSYTVWVSYNKGQSPAFRACDDGCFVYQVLGVADPVKNPDGDYYIGGTADFHKLMKVQYTGETCQEAEANGSGDLPVKQEPPTGTEPPTPPKKPLCDAAEGVLTTSKGTIACVPEGTVGAEKPKIDRKKETQVFADGSKKITDTTTTQAPSTGVKDVNVKVTITPDSSGGTGAAGTPGTSTSSTATAGGGAASGGEGDGDGDGSCDPTLNFCGGPGTDGLYTKKDKTFQSVIEQFRDGASNAPVVKAANSYLTATVPAGACPSWVVHVPLLDVTLDLSSQFCSQNAINTMQLVGYIIVAGVAFVGFKWAIL